MLQAMDEVHVHINCYYVEAHRRRESYLPKVRQAPEQEGDGKPPIEGMKQTPRTCF
jgi:hypothetical protein